MESQDWEPIGDTLQATERLADRVFRARCGRDRFVVYLEAYTRWQASAPWSVLSKSGLLSERERLPTMSLVFILLPRGYRAQHGRFQLAVNGKPTQQVWFREVCLWQLEPEDWWAESPGVMALYPLCRHHQNHRAALAHAAQTIADGVDDKIIRADLLTTLCIFGKLANPAMNVFEVIEREAMKESKFYQEILEEGRTEGRTEGRAEGRAAGLVEGRREGVVENARASVHQAIALRFGDKAAAECQECLRAIVDPATLTQLHRLAIKSKRLADFRRALAGSANGP